MKKVKIKTKSKKEEPKRKKEIKVKKEEKFKEIEIKEEKKKVEAEKEKTPQATFDFQLENVTRAEPASRLEIKQEAKTKVEFNLEEFLQGVPIKEKTEQEKKYVSKPAYSIEKYVKDQGAERKYVDSAKEWRESMVAKTEHIKELFPVPPRKVRLREETMTTESLREEVETRLSPEEAIEYDYRLRFEETGDWHKKEKRIKKYEIVK